jgi:hypothetical protein
MPCPRGGTLKEILATRRHGPVREVHVWVDRAWGLQDAASAEKFDKPHGFYNGIQIVDRFSEKMEIPSNIHWDLWLAPRRSVHSTRPISPVPAGTAGGISAMAP